MSDPRFVEAVRNVKHDDWCDQVHFTPRRNACNCTRDARIAAGLEAMYEAMAAGWEITWRSKLREDLAVFTSASAPKEG